jgi:hypothetical protein
VSSKSDSIERVQWFTLLSKFGTLVRNALATKAIEVGRKMLINGKVAGLYAKRSDDLSPQSRGKNSEFKIFEVGEVGH